MATPEEMGIVLSGLSRHGDVYAQEGTGKMFLTLRERMPRVFDDSTPYACKGGEFLPQVVVSAYKEFFQDPLSLLPVVAEFQEDPIIDLSVPLEQGRMLDLPSISYITDFPFGDPLTEFPDIA